MDKLKEQVNKGLEQLACEELNPQNIDTVGKLVDIKKDIAKIEHLEKEDNDMRYYDEDYGRRRRDSRGRYMGHHMPDVYWGRIEDGYEGYMDGVERYRRGNYNGKGQSIESLEKMLDGIVAFVDDIQNDPEQMEEKEVVNRYIRRLREM